MRRREVKPRQAAELKKPIAAEQVLRLQLSSPVGVVISLVLEGLHSIHIHVTQTRSIAPRKCKPRGKLVAKPASMRYIAALTRATVTDGLPGSSA